MSDVFNQLSLEDQKAAIDLAICTLVIGERLSADKALYDYVLTEFARSRTIPSNLAKYAMRSLGENLLKQDWSLTIKKAQGELTTEFYPAPSKNGEIAS